MSVEDVFYLVCSYLPPEAVRTCRFLGRSFSPLFYRDPCFDLSLVLNWDGPERRLSVLHSDFPLPPPFSSDGGRDKNGLGGWYAGNRASLGYCMFRGSLDKKDRWGEKATTRCRKMQAYLRLFASFLCEDGTLAVYGRSVVVACDKDPVPRPLHHKRVGVVVEMQKTSSGSGKGKFLPNNLRVSMEAGYPTVGVKDVVFF